jgi:hypothetical protein
LENDDEAEVAFVVPTSIINPDSYKELAFKDLVCCTCVVMNDEQDDFCVNNPYYNTGKTTYLVRYPDQYLVRLVDTKPELVIIPPENLKILLGKLQQIPKVNAVKAEYIVSDKLKESIKDTNSYMIRANIDINSDKIIDHSVSFVVTEQVWNIESGHEWAVNNLMDLIEKNNAE